MEHKPSLVIYLPNLASGGAERLHVQLAPEFVRAGFNVTFLLHRREGSLLPLVPEEVRIVSMDCGRTLKGLLPLAKFLKREKPDLLLANLGHNNIMAIWAAALSGSRTKIITSFHSVLSAETSRQANWQYRILPFLCRLFLRQADGTVAVSKGVAKDLNRVTGLPMERISVVYNPGVSTDFDRRMAEPVNHPWLTAKALPVVLAVGRLVETKDFATLLAAFAELCKTKPARLILLGEGPQHESLLHQAEALGIKDRVDMPGFVANPLPYMKQADVLAMSSRYEGFGNVLAEALACGTPVVSTDCPYGPAEILDHGRYGILVPVGDTSAMAKAMAQLLEHAPDREPLKERGREFTTLKTAQGYIDLFKRLA